MNSIKKLGIKNIVYICLFIISIAFITGMFVWAANTPSEDISIIDADVVLEKDARREYLVGEEISSEGISLEIDNINVADVQLSGDTSSAGLKKVEVSYQKDNIYYRGYFSIKVFAIRHYDVRNVPEVYEGDNGELLYRGIEIWVELNAQPSEFVTVGNYDTTIALPSFMYEVSISRDETDSSEILLSINGKTQTWNYYYVVIGEQMVALNSKDRILEFSNQNGTGETLKLYVTQIEADGNDGENGALGYYEFTAADGKVSILRFSYYINGYESHFTSSSFGEGVTEAQVGDDYEMTFAGVTFRADVASWHKAILGW